MFRENKIVLCQSPRMALPQKKLKGCLIPFLKNRFYVLKIKENGKVCLILILKNTAIIKNIF